MSQLDSKTGLQNPILICFPQEYTNKQWRGFWKGANVNSTTATISINVNLQQSIKIRKISICLKGQETSLHINDSPPSDLGKA